jgi:high frequency lysogenization protein
MKYSKWEYQNIALAAIAQSATLVESLAVRGAADGNAVAACIDPLLNFNPASIRDLYPNVIQLSMGLRTLQEIFDSSKPDRNPEIVRYLLGILALRQKLMSDSAMQDRLRDALDPLRPLDDYGDDRGSDRQQQFFKQIADVYQSTISTYSFRIHVKGNLEYLRDEATANKVRSLLLAGIRSAVLWYQIGGRRWHLILYRKKITQTVGDIRRNLLTSV